MHSVLDPPWTQLRRVALALEATDLPWLLGGSALQAALGCTDEVGDLDIIVPPDALDAVRAALAHLDPVVDLGPAPAPWCSDWVLRCELDGMDVEVIGGLCVVAAGRRVVLPMWAGGAVDIDGVQVTLADPAVWWWLYRHARPEAAGRLETAVTADRRAAIVAHLGPAHG